MCASELKAIFIPPFLRRAPPHSFPNTELFLYVPPTLIPVKSGCCDLVVLA